MLCRCTQTEIVPLLFECKFLVHFKHLLAIEMYTHQDDPSQKSKRNGSNRANQRPTFHLGNVAGIYEVAEEVSKQRNTGVALEYRSGMRERHTSKLDKQYFHQHKVLSS